MKKFTKRRFIAVLRKYRILNNLKKKPILSTTVVALSLIILVMLFTTPDTVSAIADLCMASAAVFAAYHAKDWLSPKINDRKFKFADELIDDFCTLQQEAFYLHKDTKHIINADPDSQGDPLTFSKAWGEIVSSNITYRENTINLRSKLERMSLWGLKARNTDDFEGAISQHLNLSYEIDDSLAIGPEDVQNRNINSWEYDRKISKKYACVRGSHNKLMKHYNFLFYS
ncbi:hypothetical protein [Pectobacterium versatile]|uniref:hypothetical protein n=1 Tax=Pectobacterium versatile TaxID=2488639 RepID=UPI0032EEA9E2